MNTVNTMRTVRYALQASLRMQPIHNSHVSTRTSDHLYVADSLSNMGEKQGQRKRNPSSPSRLEQPAREKETGGAETQKKEEE